MRGKPGRPIGSRTFRETPAVKRARAFFELQFDGMKPTAAAKVVAAEWQVSESTVFKDYQRHVARLLASARRRTRELQIEFGRMLVRDHPGVAAAFARGFAGEFNSMSVKLAAQLDALGNPAAAQAVRAYDPETATNGDAWLALLGQQYIALLRRSRDKAGRM